MKFLKFLIVLFFVTGNMFAQQTQGAGGGFPKGFPISVDSTVTMSLAQYKDRIFGALDLSAAQISSGFLMEYSLLGWDTNKFNYNSATDSIHNAQNWLQLYGLLRKSQVNQAANLPYSTDSIQNIAKSYVLSGDTIPVMVLDQAYHSIRQSSYNEGCFTIDADDMRLYDVAGRASNPYTTNRMFAVGVYKNTVMEGIPHSFYFPRNLWFSNTLQRISVDFGDGQGYRTASPNSIFSIIYATEGYKYIKIRKPTGIAGGRSEGFEVQVVKIAVLPGVFKEVTGGTLTPDYTWTLTSNYAYNGQRTKLHARVYMGCGGKLDRPVFILEGFDPSNSYSSEDLVSSFYDKIPNGINIITGNSILGKDFLRSLYAQGYDLVFVNWNDVTAPIEANALALETLIEYTNSKTEVLQNSNTVIGVSMGGLIARYCLKSMENKGKRHLVTNYFSYDSPHQGVFIPIGLQFIIGNALQDFEGVSVVSADVANFIKSSNSPAAAQMMVYLHSDEPLQMIDFMNTRKDFAAKLQKLGYPQQCDNHALINSNSVGGDTWNFQANDALLNARVEFLLVNFSFYAKASPPVGQSSNVGFYTYMGVTIKKIFGIPYFGIDLKSKWIKMTTPIILDGIYDNASGSGASTQNQIASNVPKTGGLFSEGTTFGRDFHTFVPTASALDLQNQDYGTNDLWFSRRMRFDMTATDMQYPVTNRLKGLTYNPNSPFTSYNKIVFSANHPTFYLTDMQYIHQVMTGTNNFILSCFGLCQNNASSGISGDAVLCVTNPIGNYATNYNLSATETVIWTSSNNLRLLVSNNNIASFELIDTNFQGSQWVQASVFSRTTNCSSLTNRFDVWVGEPAPIRFTGEVENCSYVITANSAGATNFEWKVTDDNNNDISFSIFSTANKIYIHASQWISLNLNKIQVTCKSSNNCNRLNPNIRTQKFSRPVFEQFCVLRVIPSPKLNIFPNPTNAILNLEFENLPSKVSSISVQNMLGIKVLCAENIQLSANNKTNLDLSTLPEGIYILQVIYENGTTSSQKIGVQRGIIAD